MNEAKIVLDQFDGEHRGMYVDVGAGQPEGSITQPLYDVGWHGINFEPYGPDFEELQKVRLRDTNVNIAISDYEGFGHLDTTIVDGQRHVVKRHNTEADDQTDILVSTLDNELNLYELQVLRDPIGRIDLLCVDVGGEESKVLRGMDWDRHPLLVCVRAVDAATGVPTHRQWEQDLTDRGYGLLLATDTHRIYRFDAPVVDPLTPVTAEAHAPSMVAEAQKWVLLP